MFDSCIACGAFAPDEGFVPDPDADVCPKCGYRRLIAKHDLFIVFGPSGSGKSSLRNVVLTRPDRPDLIYLDSDVLLSLRDHMHSYVDYWMFICANISQSGHPVVLFSGNEPPEFEQCERRPLFSQIHYLALVSSDEDLKNRLQSRPSSRWSSSDEAIVGMQEWNQALKASGSDANDISRGTFDMLDTTDKSLEESASDLIRWFGQHLETSQ